MSIDMFQTLLGALGCDINPKLFTARRIATLKEIGQTKEKSILAFEFEITPEDKVIVRFYLKDTFGLTRDSIGKNYELEYTGKLSAINYLDNEDGFELHKVIEAR